jgi:hypothetical protein
MQDERHFEIGLHNDLVTLQAIYGIDPVKYLTGELKWLRSNGINVTGTSSHGSNYCKTYGYLNYYFFQECADRVISPYGNNMTIPVDGKTITIKKAKLSDFDLDYEAYFLDNNLYFSDASITSGKRWHIGKLDFSTLKPGDRVILLIHPIHWHKASTRANFETFDIQGETDSDIDTVHCVINVRMPFRSDRSQIAADFSVSPGAYVKVDGKMQSSAVTTNDFTKPVTYVVYAENRSVQQKWIVKVITDKRKAANADSLSVKNAMVDADDNPFKGSGPVNPRHGKSDQ